MHRKTTEDRARIMVDKILVDKNVSPLATEMKIFNKDLYKHSLNVAFITAQIVTQLDYTKSKQYDIVIAAFLHDIGKLAIPVDLITKEGNLTPQEYEIIKMHVNEGVNILKDAGFNDFIIRLVATHHETLDGSGYPNGLDQTKLTAEDRLIATVDKYDALTSKRSYGKEYASYEAIGVLIHEGNVDTECLRYINACEAI